MLPGERFRENDAFTHMSGKCRGDPAEAGQAQLGRSEDPEDRADSERIPLRSGDLSGSRPRIQASERIRTPRSSISAPYSRRLL